MDQLALTKTPRLVETNWAARTLRLIGINWVLMGRLVGTNSWLGVFGPPVDGSFPLNENPPMTRPIFWFPQK